MEDEDSDADIGQVSPASYVSVDRGTVDWSNVNWSGSPT